MGAKFKSGFKPEDKVGKLMAVYAKRAEKAAKFLVTRMVADTNNGIDINGEPFPGYSDKYKQYRSDRKYQVDPPNLTITGQMLKAMTSEVSLTRKDLIVGKIFFRNLNTAYSAKRLAKKVRKDGQKRKRKQKSTTKKGATRMVSTIDRAKGNLRTRKFFGMSPRHLQFFLNYLRGKNAR